LITSLSVWSQTTKHNSGEGGKLPSLLLTSNFKHQKPGTRVTLQCN